MQIAFARMLALKSISKQNSAGTVVLSAATNPLGRGATATRVPARPRARQNVGFEHGTVIARLGRECLRAHHGAFGGAGLHQLHFHIRPGREPVKDLDRLSVQELDALELSVSHLKPTPRSDTRVRVSNEFAKWAWKASVASAR
jgi:hypothetical protein